MKGLQRRRMDWRLCVEMVPKRRCHHRGGDIKVDTEKAEMEAQSGR